jgi:hypothetical protein
MAVPVMTPVAAPAPPRRSRPGLVGVLVALALAMATAAVLGPLVLGVLTYRTSATTLNQALGADAAALVVVAPLTLLAAGLVRRGRVAGAALATGVGVFAIYTYIQVIVGQEYLRLPGNVERFFPLLLAVVVLGEAAVVFGLRALPRQLPVARRIERAAGIALLAVAAFLVLGLHLPTMLTAWSDPSALTQYASSPTPFWLVKLMDLGVVVPAAVTTGVGLLRAAPWARRAAYALLTGYDCLAVSVTAMAVLMLVKDDPDASAGLAVGFGLVTAVLVALTVALYRPLDAPDRDLQRAL